MRHSVAVLRLAALGLLGACGAGEDLTQPVAGELTVVVSTGGDQPDPDGYALAVDGGGGVPLTPADTLPIGALEPGEHRLELSGLAANCFVTGLNPLTVTVVAGSPTEAAFEVSCTATVGTGRIVVRVATTGPDSDPDGYVAVVDPLPPHPVAGTDSVTFEQLTDGTHAVRLDGVAPNCEVRGENPRAVEVTAETGTTLFEVSCWPPPSGAVAFLRGDPQGGGGADVFVVNGDGTGLRNLSGTPELEKGSLAWSPDGTTLAYHSLTADENGFPTGEHGVFLVPRGGDQSPTLLELGTLPLWSPDATRILFHPEGGGLKVIAPATGRIDTLVRTSFDGFVGTAAWSPNGRRIVFAQVPPDFIFWSLQIADANGLHPRTVSDQSRLSGDYVVHGWQPGGSKILMTVSEPFDELYLVDTASSIPPSNLTQDPADSYESVSWSPDGSMILFIKLPAGAFPEEREIYTVRLSDMVFTKISARPGGYIGAAWSPDRHHIVYTEEEGLFFTPSHLYIVNADGSGLRQLSAGEKRDLEPVWAP